MTADDAGKVAFDGVWVTLKRIKEQWLLLVFMAGALFWARDTIDQYLPLPGLVGGLAARVEAINASVARLEQAGNTGAVGDRSPVLAFPGTGHDAADARPGEWAQVRLAPVRTLRDDCRPTGVWAYMVDSSGRWFAVDTELAPMPHLTGDADLAFGVRVHPRMARGRARVSVQITHDCGTYQQVDTAPWMHFIVLGD